MSSAALDRLLAVLLAAIGGTGIASLLAGSERWAWLFAAHATLGGALLVACGLKLRRSLPALRRRTAGRGGTTVLFTTLVLGSVGLGFAAVATGRVVVAGPWTLISWHALLGLAALPLLVAHLLPRRWRVLRPADRSTRRLSRRTVLAAGALGLAGVAARIAADALDRAGGGSRRFTGSRPLTTGGAPPPTTFLGEWIAPLDPDAWRLTVSGAVATPGTFDRAALAALPHETRRAILDCTSGWAHEGDWTGVPLRVLLARVEPAPTARRVVVRAVTGWAAAFTLADADGALLATAVGGQPLAHGNGAPCRLVLPDHRGLEWVKWVDRIELS